MGRVRRNALATLGADRTGGRLGAAGWVVLHADEPHAAYRVVLLRRRVRLRQLLSPPEPVAPHKAGDYPVLVLLALGVLLEYVRGVRSWRGRVCDDVEVYDGVRDAGDAAVRSPIGAAGDAPGRVESRLERRTGHRARMHVFGCSRQGRLGRLGRRQLERGQVEVKVEVARQRGRPPVAVAPLWSRQCFHWCRVVV